MATGHTHGAAIAPGSSKYSVVNKIRCLIINFPYVSENFALLICNWSLQNPLPLAFRQIHLHRMSIHASNLNQAIRPIAEEWPSKANFRVQVYCFYSGSVFTARRSARIASPVLAIAVPSACPSVCLSHAGICLLYTSDAADE